MTIPQQSTRLVTIDLTENELIWLKQLSWLLIHEPNLVNNVIAYAKILRKTFLLGSNSITTIDGTQTLEKKFILSYYFLCRKLYKRKLVIKGQKIINFFSLVCQKEIKVENVFRGKLFDWKQQRHEKWTKKSSHGISVVVFCFFFFLLLLVFYQRKKGIYFLAVRRFTKHAQKHRKRYEGKQVAK